MDRGTKAAIYLDEPIKRLLGQLVLFGMLSQILRDPGPNALKLFQCGRHGEILLLQSKYDGCRVIRGSGA
jgi:hypothetical protein